MKHYMPAEWEPHDACWLAWPSHEDLWGEILPEVQAEFTALCRNISYAPANQRGEALRILVPNAQSLSQAQTALAGLPVEFVELGFGDIWLRDTGPLFLRDTWGDLLSACFGFNGWGGKYDLPFDKEVSAGISARTGLPTKRFPLVLEGGSIEVDGEGTCLTTEQCLLNPNRNAQLSRHQVEAFLAEALGTRKTLWLREGLLNDHTDGHIDTLARFVGPGEVVCMQAQDDTDPNAHVLEQIHKCLTTMRDAGGRTLVVHTIPSPGLVKDAQGKILPASYVNFYISNHTVCVPNYSVAMDAKANEALQALFPRHKVIGSPARKLLEGGGAFHCITQQQPRLKETPRQWERTC